MLRLPLLLNCAFICALVSACARAPQELVLSGSTMGTTYVVKIVGTPSTIDEAAVRAALNSVLDSVDMEMSTYRPDSAISRFNASRSTDWFDVPLGLARVVAAAHEVSVRSGGAFDITIAPLIEAWGFGPSGEPLALPTEQELTELRERTGYDLLDVRLEQPALRKHHPELTIDVNGIAPGYAVDLLAERFEALGLHDFMIDIGGEVLTRGRNALGTAWQIAVERPIEEEPQQPFVILQLEDVSVTTSGEYRHYFEREGQRYSHTIDPRTGRPIQSFGSVCVVGPSSLLIDAWATVLNVLGPEQGLALAEKEGLAAMYIVAEGDELRARTSSEFRRTVKLVEPRVRGG
ncbi:MAG TPA: FAD:protein FMN transferase [Steroidobacteraceae bacterium]